MTIIHLITIIHAPIETCFDLSRDVGIHQLSTIDTKEIAVAGRTSGLCEVNDEITWEAKHFGIKQRLTVRITKMNQPFFFEDIMLKGAFKAMMHEHYFENFETKNNQTIMQDVFKYEVPFGFIGQFFDKLVLKKYMTKFLLTRNKVLKDMAEKASR